MTVAAAENRARQLREIIPLGTLTPLLADHLRWMIRAKRYQRRTILKRWRELVLLERQMGVTLDQADRDDLHDWWGELPWKRTTCATKLAHARAFYGWAVDSDRIDRDPTRGIRSPKVHRTTPRPLSPEAVIAMLARLYGVKHYAPALMFYCGTRDEETARVRPAKDIVPGPEGPMLIVHGKGGSERQVHIPTDLANRIRTAAAGREWLFEGRGEDGHWTPEYMSTFVAGLLRDHGITGTPHQLRHTFATYLYQRTGDLVATGKALGHRGINSTQVYADAAPIARDVLDHMYRKTTPKRRQRDPEPTRRTR